MCIYKNGAACECDIRDGGPRREGIMRPEQESESKQKTGESKTTEKE